MQGEVKYILSVTLGVLVLAMGIVLIGLKIPPIEKLKNYQSACRIIGVGYILVSPLMCIYHIGVDWHFTQNIILLIASLLAFAFTSTFITLIDVRFSLKQIAWRELLPIGVLTTSSFATYYLCDRNVHRVVFLFFIVYYVCSLVRYISLFVRACRRYKNQENNYFSNSNTHLLSWVKRSFYFASLIGVLALVAIVAPLSVFILFKLLIIPFFIYSFIQLINYSVKFHYQDPVFLSNQEDENSPIDESNKNALTYQELAERINDWVKQKTFLDNNFTIEDVAKILKTNRTYLSFYINNYEKKTFREWIVYLRIEEAKSLFISYPNISISEVGERVGYPDRSNFNRQFTKQTGQSPKMWRRHIAVNGTSGSVEAL